MPPPPARPWGRQAQVRNLSRRRFPSPSPNRPPQKKRQPNRRKNRKKQCRKTPAQNRKKRTLLRILEISKSFWKFFKRKDWKNSPEYEMITAQKAKVLSQLISSFYHGQDSLDLRDTAWGDCDLPGMPDGGKTNEKRRKKDIGAGFGESYDTDACSVQ